MGRVRASLNLCRDCGHTSSFVVVMRHGAEWPACTICVGYVLQEAFDHDGDHGHVDVYLVGVSDLTLEGA